MMVREDQMRTVACGRATVVVKDVSASRTGATLAPAMEQTASNSHRPAAAAKRCPEDVAAPATASRALGSALHAAQMLAAACPRARPNRTSAMAWRKIICLR